LRRQGKADQHAAARLKLRNAFEKFRERAADLAGEIPRDLPFLTVHDVIRERTAKSNPQVCGV
jgi:hypothetical protein